MILKFTHCLTVLAFITFISYHTQAQTKKEIAGKLFLSQSARTFPRNINALFLLHQPFRSYDGTANNISSRQSLEWGASDIALFREIPAQYGASDPNNAMAGSTRPTPRLISNLLCDEPVTHFNERELSTYVYVWGQFIDHDMS